MRRGLAALAALVLLTFPLSGCWNYREVDTLSIVAGFAVDSGQQGHKYHLAIDIADTSSAGKDKPVQTKLLESEGDTIFDAVRTAAERNGLTLYWQNCQIVVVSREVAEESLLPIVDFISRTPETRITIEIFVSGEDTAKAILEAGTSSMSIKSFELDKIYEQNERTRPVAKYIKTYEISNTLASEGASLTLPCIRHAQNGTSHVCEIAGMSLFRKDKLAGTLTEDDSLYAMFVMNSVKGGMLNIKASTENSIAALEILDSKTTVVPVTENGEIRFTVRVDTEAALAELDEQADVGNKEQFEGFTAAAEAQLKGEIVRVLGIVQGEYGLDIFGFGEALHRSDPDTWYQVRANWAEVFRAAPVEVTCTINIHNSGERHKPVKAGG